jgi:hypothetical protein
VALEHRSSCAADPHAHVHVLVQHAARSPGGRWSALGLLTATDRSSRATPLHLILGIGQRQPPRGLLGRPPHRQLGLHYRPQPRLQHQLGRLRTLGPAEGRGVGDLSPITTTAAVSGQFPRHPRRARPSRAAICRHGSPAATLKPANPSPIAAQHATFAAARPPTCARERRTKSRG